MNRMIRKVAAQAEEKYGKDTVGRILAGAQARYEELLAENSNEPPALQKHTRKRVYPGIALYETMQAEGISKKDAKEYIREYFQVLSRAGNKAIRIVLRLPGLAHQVPVLFTRLSVASFSPDAGFVYRFPERTGKGEAAFNIIQCPYFDACKRYGCEELTTAFCDSDDTTYGEMHQSLLWGRSGTIGRGMSCCDFRLTDVRAKKR